MSNVHALGCHRERKSKLTAGAARQIGAEDVKGESSIGLVERKNGGIENGVNAGTAHHFRHHVLEHAESQRRKSESLYCVYFERRLNKDVTLLSLLMNEHNKIWV